MNSIKNNPYRVLGLFIGASTREIERQVRRLKQYLEAGQNIPNELVQNELKFLGPLHRTVDSLNEAVSKLNLDNDRMNSAIFWFCIGNDITDEPALEALKNSDFTKSASIWTKLISSGEVNKKNWSAFHNLSTLLILLGMSGKELNKKLFEQGLTLKLKFLESDLVMELKAKVTDETYKTTKKELQVLFLNTLQSDIEKSVKITFNNFIEILSKISFVAKDEFLKSCIQKPIEQIENEIEVTRMKRKTNKGNAANYGNELFQHTNHLIIQLKNILGANNIEYINIADNLAEEILNCSLEYFLYFRDTDNDPVNVSMPLTIRAKEIAAGNIIRSRIEENIQELNEWIESKSEREKQKRIAVDFDRLKLLWNEYEAKEKTINNAKQLLTTARPYLENIKNVLGVDDILYLNLSTGIAAYSLSMCVSVINNLQQSLENSYLNSTQLSILSLLKRNVNSAWEVINIIGTMDLTQDFKEHYKQNRAGLSELIKQLSEVNNYKETTNESCYIATMVYGDYNHPQVMKLRKFRDEILKNSPIGMLFIKIYYWFGPKFVLIFKNQKLINKFVKKTLNQIIKIIE